MIQYTITLTNCSTYYTDNWATTEENGYKLIQFTVAEGPTIKTTINHIVKIVEEEVTKIKDNINRGY